MAEMNQLGDWRNQAERELSWDWGAKKREGLRIPFNGTSSHQFSRNSVADVATKGTTPFHFAPVTPDRGAWRIQSSQSTSFTHFFRNERLQGRRQDEYLRYMVGPPINKNKSINFCTNKDPSQAAAPSPTTVLSATPLKETHNCGNEEAHRSLDLNNTPPQKTRNKRPFLPRFLPQPAFPSPTSILSATPVKETENKEEGHQGLDLNTPPPQKARRKRHRPKVITEGKPKKTPKPSAPKQNRNKEKESVSKTTLKRHVIPPAGEGGVAESHGSKEGVKSSCRRALNFDLEYSPIERISADGGSSAPFNLNLHPQPHDMCEVTFKNSPGPSKSTVQLGHGLELVVENTPAGVPFDINRSLTQMLNDYISLPQNSSSLPPIARNEPTKESIKDWDRKKSLERMPSYLHTQGADCTIIPAPDSSLDNQMCTRLSCLESGIQSASRTLYNPNNRLCAGLADVDPTEKGSKRAYSEIINAAHHPTYHLDPYFSFYAGSESIQDTSSADIRKKKRIDVRHNEVASSVPSSVMRAPGDHETFNKLHFMASNSLCVGYPSSKVLPCIDAKRGGPVLNKIQDLKSMLIPGHTNITKRRSKTPVRIRKLASITVATEGHQFPPSHGNSFRNEIKAAQCQENPEQKKSIRKGPTIPVESLSCNSTNQAGLLGHEVETSDNCQSLVQSRGALCQKSFMPTSSSQTSRFGTVPINLVQERQIKNATFDDRTTVSSKDFIEDIVQRLKYLDINQGDMVSAEVQYALPSHAVELQMVPYKGLFDPTKKRQRPRAKIDMDEETNRVWKLLMWKEGSDGQEGMDTEKEKRWEEERIAFRGRADSFIARMHLVQGDRRFSQWKGSVVDSVVGVFLTQNVSDHLSSSAFMALAAKFSLQPRTTNSRPEAERMSKSPEETVGSFLEYNKWQDEMLRQGVLDQGSFALREETVEKDKFSSIESFESNTGPKTENYSKGKKIAFYDNGPDVSQESPESQTEIPRAQDDVVLSQNSVISFTDSNVQIVDQIWPNYESSFEADNIVTGYRCNGLDGCDNISFTELLKMQGTKMLQDFYSGDKLIPPDVTVEGIEFPSRSSFDNGLVGHPSNFLANPQTPTKQEFMFHAGLDISSAELESVAMSADESCFSLPSSASEMTEGRDISFKGTKDKIAIDNVAETVILPSPSSQDVSIGDSYIPVTVSNHPVHLSHGSGPKTLAEASSQRRDSGMAQSSSPSYNYAERPLDVRECSILADNDSLRSSSKDLFNISEKGPSGTTNDRSIATRRKGGAEKNKAFDWDSLRRQVCLEASRKERTHDTMDSLDYEALRCADVNEIADTIKERGMNNMLAERIKAFLNRLVSEHGSIDLEWLRDVPPDKAKDFLLSIRGLGLKSVECVRLLTLHQLAFPVDTNVGRICVRLGWVPLQPLPESLQLHLLDLYPVQASIQKYLWPRLCKLDQRTLYELHYQMITFGKVFCTKSNPNCNACPMRAECRHFASAFASARLALPGPKDKSLVASPAPVTTTLGRDHEVALNPLPLPPLEHASQSESSVPLMMTLAEANEVAINTLPLPPFEKAPLSEPESGITVCEPIIEEPASPEPEILGNEISETAIEDAFWEDPDEIPTIKLNFEEFTQNVQNYIENNMQLQDGEMSKALVALSPEAASVPVPKLKNLSRLRTEHQVYQLPDSHPLLQGLDPREPDDPSPYLLAIWTPGETAQSIQPTELPCNSQESGNLCDENTCFACNGIREVNAQTVRGTLLIPCRTAMRGSFPLNGTYFQVNEVFADHDSSLQPIDVPRALIWNLPRRTVFFGTSIPTIFRGLTTEGIQHCFWRGFVCVRGFDKKTRAPRPLMARLHFPAYKQMRAKKTPNKSSEKATKRER